MGVEGYRADQQDLWPVFSRVLGAQLVAFEFGV